MDHAFAVLSTEEPDADLAALAAQIGRFRFFAGEGERALERGAPPAPAATRRSADGCGASARLRA
jgi:hypothetical protein